MLKNFKPLSDRVLIERLKNDDEKTAGGIIIPEAAKEKAQIGKVLAVGPGRTNNSGQLIPCTVREGDKVFFGKYAGTDAGEGVLVIREDEILGIIEE